MRGGVVLITYCLYVEDKVWTLSEPADTNTSMICLYHSQRRICMKALPCAAPPAALWVTRYPRGLLPLPPNVKKRQGEISRGRFCRELLLPAHARRRDIASLFRARRALQRLVRVVCVNTKTFDVTGNVGLQQPPPPTSSQCCCYGSE